MKTRKHHRIESRKIQHLLRKTQLIFFIFRADQKGDSAFSILVKDSDGSPGAGSSQLRQQHEEQEPSRAEREGHGDNYNYKDICFVEITFDVSGHGGAARPVS